MKYNDLFKYRNIWMGFAILWIAFYHMDLFISSHIVRMIHELGYAGCDIFLFASGIGIYYSLEKNDDVYSYIKRRFIRLMPMFWIFLIFWFVFRYAIHNMHWRAVIGNIFCVQFFIDSDYDFNWYIPLIWICYIIAPYFKKIIEKINGKTGGMICILILMMVINLSFAETGIWLMALTRIPIFVLGMYFGSLGKKERRCKGGTLIFFVIISIALYLIVAWSAEDNFLRSWHSGILWYPFLIIAPTICFALSFVANAFEKNKIPAYINQGLSFIGKHSLEIYFVHCLVKMVYEEMVERGLVVSRNLYYMNLTVIVMIGSVLLCYLTKAVMFVAGKIYHGIKIGERQ